MVVQHNLQAMNANRMLGVTTDSQSKATEKLSSGYKINRAADDAAGLSISEKMRKQIRGLDQASANAQDGISAVQTAEGALTEVHDMLQRMNELAVQAANGTNSVSDRQSIQDEIEQLTTEIDRVSETTKFNETYLLKGNGKTSTAHIAAKDAGITGELLGASTSKAKFKMNHDMLKNGSKISIGGREYTIGTTLSTVTKMITAQLLPQGTTITINGVEYTVTAGKTSKEDNIYTAEDLAAMIEDGDTVIIRSHTYVTMMDSDKKDGIGDNNSLIITTKVALKYIAQELQRASSIGTDPGKGAKVSTNTTMKDGKSSLQILTKEDGVKSLSDLENDTIEWADVTGYRFTITTGTVKVDQGLQLSLHVGADADGTNKIAFNVDTISSRGLGIHGLNIVDKTGAKATYAIDSIADAVAKVSAQRSSLGAIQNRLEHTIKNLDNVVENTTSAESQIRDTDMAEEMVEFSKNNILAQAGQSMLAQANQSNQGVLSLLG